MEIKVKKLNSDAKLPRFAHPGDAGMDLYSTENLILKPGQLHKVKTGLSIELPENYASLIWDKSGIASQKIKTVGGVIDSGYRGEYMVAMINLGQADYKIEKGDKIAQLLIQKVENPSIVEIDDLSESSRKDGGFGSTGIK